MNADKWSEGVVPAALSIFMLLALGCASIGQHKIIAPPLKTPEQDARSTVLLVVAEGLRQDVFDDHLKALELADNEPQWRSGLSLLALDGFRFASSQRAEAPIGASALSSAATVAMGSSPGSHGIVGSRFISRYSGSPAHVHDFTDAHHASGVWYTNTVDKPDLTTPNELSLLTHGTTWLSRLAAVLPVGVAFHPYGHGTSWTIPDRRTVGSLAMVHSPVGALAVPLLDAAARKATAQLLQTGHRVVLFPFRGVRANSCYRGNASCEVATSGLIQQQARSLRRLDEALWYVLQQYRLKQRGDYRNMSVLLVGTHGIIDRSSGPRPNRVHVIEEQRLKDHIGAQFDTPDCLNWFSTRGSRELQVVRDGAVARVYLPSCRPGQCFDPLPRQCLSKAVKGMIQKTQWLAGAMWLDDNRADGRPLGLRYKIELRKAFGSSIRAYRRARLLKKMRRAVDSSDARRTGDAILFASSRWTFEGGGPTSGYAHEGGLADAAMSVPFFIASRHLTDAAPSSVRIAPLELLDVGPTVYALLGLPMPEKVFHRPPVVQWRTSSGMTLEFVKADRQIAGPVASNAPQLTWHETSEAITIGLSEPASHWPPETLKLTLGERTMTWTSTEDSFDAGVSCDLKKEDGRRLWRCSFPVDRSKVISLKATAMRIPGTRGEKEQALNQVFEVGGAPPTLDSARLTCRSEKRVGVAIKASDESGLERADVFLARSSASERLVRGATFASTGLGVSPDCAQEKGCSKGERVKRLNDVVFVPFETRQLTRLRWADQMVGRADAVGRAAQRTATQLGMSGPSPVSDWLVVRICNRGGKCADRRLSSDAAYLSPDLPPCPAP